MNYLFCAKWHKNMIKYALHKHLTCFFIYYVNSYVPHFIFINFPRTITNQLNDQFPVGLIG